MYPEKKGGSHKMARPQQNWGLLTLLTRWASIWTMPNTALPKSGACYVNRGYRYGARGMDYHILLRQYSQNYYTYTKIHVSKFQLGISNDCCIIKA